MSDTTPASPSAAPLPRRGGLAVVYATVFLDLLGFGLILPFLPFYALHLGASGLELGLLLTSYSLAQLAGAAVLGRASDRFGRRPVLLLSLAGSALGMLLSGLATALVTLVAARALAGLFGGSIATAQAYVADVTRRDERARFMGLLGASIGLGFVVGPALGVALDVLGFGFPGAAFTAAGLATANLVAATFLLREPRPVGERAAVRPPGFGRWLRALGRPRLWQALVATFLVTFAFVSMETTFALLGEARFAMAPRTFGLVLVFVGVVMIAVQGGLVGVLSRRFGVHRVAVAGGATMAAGLLLVPAAPTLPLAAGALGLLAAGQGLSSPSLSTLVSHRSGAEEQGSVLGLGQSLAAAARAVGPFLAGTLYDLRPAAPYATAGLLALLAAVLVASSGSEAPTAT